MGCRRLWGTSSALIGLLLVASGSEPLLSNATEDRHYSMFFACSAWVLYELTSKENNKNFNPFTLFFHLCLCLVHYFGIIFSVIVGLVLWVKNRKIPKTLAYCWLLAIPCHLYLLTNQSSHLGEWTRPNSISDLFDTYSGTITFLFLLIPILARILCAPNKDFSRQPVGYQPNALVIVAFIWYLTPFLASCISHISEVNLFKERYFIPKEAALIALVAFACHKAFESLGLLTCKSFAGKFISLFSTSILCLFLLLLHHRRSVFALAPHRNYYSWLIYDDQFSSEDTPLVFCRDPVFFPNLYKNPDETYFLVEDERLNSIYSQFSAKIKVVNYKSLKDFNSFILVSEKDNLPELHKSAFQVTNFGKFHERLPLLFTKFVKRKSSEAAPLA